MADMNASLILAGAQQPNYVNALAQGAQAAQMTNEVTRQNALAGLYRDQGAGIANGDTTAINMLAQIDPNRALDVQKSRLGMDATRAGMANDSARLGMEGQRLRIMSAQESRAASEYAAGLDARSRAAEAEQIEDAVKMGLAIPDAQTWDTTMSRMAPSLVGQFDNRQMYANKYMDMADILKGQQGPQPQSAIGKFYADQQAGLVPADAQPPQSGVNVNIGGDNKQVFTAVADQAQAAKSAMNGLTSIGNARKAIQDGAITGFGANARLTLQKAGVALGIADPGAVQNTETFRSAIAPQVSAMLKATVGSAQISNSDREFAEKAAGGSIDLDKGSILQLLDIMERGNRSIVDNYKQTLDRVYPDGGGFDRERALFGLPADPQATPAQANQPDAMSDDDLLRMYGGQ